MPSGSFSTSDDFTIDSNSLLTRNFTSLSLPPEHAPFLESEFSSNQRTRLGLSWNPSYRRWYWTTSGQTCEIRDLIELRNSERQRQLQRSAENIWSGLTTLSYGGMQVHAGESLVSQLGDLQNEMQGVPVPPHSPSLPFAIGDIIKWNTNINGVESHLHGLGIPVGNALLRISSLNTHSILGCREFDCAEDSEYHTEFKYFIKASSKEIKHFKDNQEALNPCTERPSIGTIIRYIGRDRTARNKRFVVVSHASDNKIYIHPMNNSFPGLAPGGYNFKIFKISKNQRDGFTPDLSNYCSCENCGSLRKIPSLILQIDSHVFCDSSCASEAGYRMCRRCGCLNSQENLTDTTDGDICRSCAPTYSACMECEALASLSRVHRTPSGSILCSSCYSNRGRIIFDYSYKPSPRYQKMVYENTRYLGIELEIELNEDSTMERDGVARQLRNWLKDKKTNHLEPKPLNKLIYFKNDGSLETGFEIVFHPFTLKSFHKNFPSKSFLEYIENQSGTTNHRCGMHVHVSKDKLSKATLIKGKWFFYKCQEFLKNFSGRENFNFCQFETNAPGEDPYNQPFGRKTALNIAGSPKTLELRLFQSTLNHEKFLANLQFSDCFVAYIQSVGSVFLIRATPHQIWENFIDYAKRTKQYQVMTNYLLKNSIV